MTYDAMEASKTHETVWSGTLSADQVGELLVDALRRKWLSIPHHGVTIEATAVHVPDGGGMPAIVVRVVHDHDWFGKTTAHDE